MSKKKISSGDQIVFEETLIVEECYIGLDSNVYVKGHTKNNVEYFAEICYQEGNPSTLRLVPIHEFEKIVHTVT